MEEVIAYSIFDQNNDGLVSEDEIDVSYNNVEKSMQINSE